MAEAFLQAIDAKDWDRAAAAHLARRAGFGASPAEIEALVELGPEGAVARHVDFPARDEELEARIALLSGELGVRGDLDVSSYEMVERMRDWWLYRLVATSHPLQEKLVLFWHDHFACQSSKVREPLLLDQNDLFRRQAAGSIRELVREVARDPAMLVFLDNRLSERGSPNENWARELLELFSLGVDRYEQADVVALARIFTGWTTPDPRSNEFLFDPERHDEGEKVFLGARVAGRAGTEGYQEGIEALDHVLAQPLTSTFLAQKLLTWFVVHDPDPRAVEELAAVLVANDWSVRETLRVLFLSRWFHASEHRFALHKSPVELLVSAARGLGIQNVHRGGFGRFLRAMGMQLFEPPSVAGWEHGAVWSSSGTAVQRLELALVLSELAHSPREVAGSCAVDFDALAPAETGGEALLDALADRLLQRPLTRSERAPLAAYVVEQEQGTGSTLSPAKRRRALTRALVHLLLASPRFALA